MILNWGGFTHDLTKQDKIGLLPKSLRAIISSCSSTRPRPAAARNCQLNISPNCGQVAAGQLPKNMTSWENRGGSELCSTKRGEARVMFRPQWDLGVLADHVEPEDGRPSTLLLAGVGDDDHREGGGLRMIRLEMACWF